MHQSQRTLQEFRTTLSPAEVLEQAKTFFSRRNSIYATFLEHESPTHVAFRGQGGEELIVGATTHNGETLVTGSTYLFDMQVARFFTTLPALEFAEMMLPPGPADTPAVTA